MGLKSERLLYDKWCLWCLLGLYESSIAEGHLGANKTIAASLKSIEAQLITL